MFENPGKVVGRRTAAPNGLSMEINRKKDALAWRKYFGGLPITKGVYRFKTHEEADAWLWRMITRPRPN